jgi:hypothetical protein
MSLLHFALHPHQASQQLRAAAHRALAMNFCQYHWLMNALQKRADGHQKWLCLIDGVLLLQYPFPADPCIPIRHHILH